MSNLIQINEDELREVYIQVIKEQVTKTIATATVHNEVKDAIKKAFQKTWMSDKDNWIETEVRATFGQAMWKAVEDAVEESGVNAMMTKVAKDYITTQEFQTNLKRRVIETVESTTFFVKPEEACDED